jgi:RHS repeat-associated protein
MNAPIHTPLRRFLQLFLLILAGLTQIRDAEAKMPPPVVGCALSGPDPAKRYSGQTYTLGGTTCADAGSWSVSVGSIISFNSTSVTIFFDNPSATSSVIKALNSSGGTIATLTVGISAASPLMGGTINNPSQAINNNTSPAAITASTPSNGNCGTSYHYQWWQSTDNNTFFGITGATNASYQPPPLTATTYYKRQATCQYEQAYTSNIATVTVYPPLAAGTIINAPSQPINNNTAPGTLSLSGTTGGSGGYSYQWQSSPDNTFNSPTNVGTNSASYIPPALTSSIYYRVKVTTSNGETTPSAPVFISVYPVFAVGSVGPQPLEVWIDTSPGTLSVSGVTGGSSSYSYDWQSSSDGVNFLSFGGPNAASYIPGNLHTTTWYRVLVTSNGVTLTSGVAKVRVIAPLNLGAITGAPTVVYNHSGTLQITGVSGGICESVNPYHYKWLWSTDSIHYQSVAGSDAATFATPRLKLNSWFICQLTCGNGFDDTLNSAPFKLTVTDRVIPGTIFPPYIIIAPGEDPGTLTASTPSGGICGGNYSYLWQQSTNGLSFSTASGTNNGPAYTTGALAASAYYRQRIICDADTEYTVATHIVVGGPFSTGMNYIKTREIVRPGVLNITDANNLTDPADVHQTTQYFDGLGRPVETVVRQASPKGFDLVNMQVYDAYDREVTKYLPYVATSTDGNYRKYPAAEQSSFNRSQFPGEQFYYGKTDYELSPLNRPIKTSAPGNSWVGNNVGVSLAYQFNDASDSVQLWNIAALAGSLPTNGGTYQAGDLTRTVTTDEHNHRVVEYKDKDRLVVLKKVQFWDVPAAGASGWLNTYYVYDDAGNLRFVMQPKATEWLMVNGFSFANSGGSTVANELCFRYEYDARNRMIAKKVPGAGEVDMVYDVRDRMVFSQDANQKPHNEWLSTQYDELNRITITSLMTYSGSVDALQQAVTNQTMTGGAGFSLAPTITIATADNLGVAQASELITLDDGFSSKSDNDFLAEIINANGTEPGYGADGIAVNLNPIPQGAIVQPLTINYYDNYDWVAGTGSGLGTALAATSGNNFISSYNSYPIYAVPITADMGVKGQATGMMHLVLGENRPLYSVNFYDNRSRQIQAQAINYTGGMDTVTNQHDFSGKVLRSLTHHNKLGNTRQTHTILTKMDYDPAFRVTNIWKNIDNTPSDQLIANLQYDELGQLKTKQLGTNLESIENEYNIRGWLLGINRNYLKGEGNHYFGIELAYDNPTATALGASYLGLQYNGNIAGTTWKSAGDGVNRKYDFTYDNVNRLMKADYKQQFGSQWGKMDPGGSGAGMDYTVTMGGYDANGNIRGMQQNGFKLGAPMSIIDNLTYSYTNNTNKLLQVIEGSNDPDSKLGDFHFKGTQQPTGYDYDDNGNLKLDNNKGIDKIVYNYLNLPQQIHVTGKGTINYTYDATGAKLQKVTTDDVSNQTTSTLYLGALQYQRQAPSATPTAGDDVLHSLGHEEGRARWAFHKYANGQTNYGWEYDFFVRDHLGNTRVVLTQEKDTAQYLATMEEAYRNTEKALFFGLDTSLRDRATTGFPNNVTVTNPNNKVTVLNGSGIRQGPALILKVMSGDKVDMSTQYYYDDAGSSHNSTIQASDILTNLAGGLFNIAGATHGAYADLNSGTGSPLLGALTSFLNDPAVPLDQSKPKAYLNYVLLDNQFRYVTDCSGALQVQSPGTANGQLQYPLAKNLPITKSGYLYIYLSNVTENQDVFFDNLSVVHTSGPMLEETHYYPFGLTMAGISDKALKSQYAENKYRYNKGSELQNKEFADGSGLEMYETPLRSLDQQLGKWWQIDPKPDHSQSPYAAMDNNPVMKTDSLGDEACCQTALDVLTTGDKLVEGIIQGGGGVANPITDGVAGFVEASTLIGSVLGLVIDLGNGIFNSPAPPHAVAAPNQAGYPGTPSSPTAPTHLGAPSASKVTNPSASATMSANSKQGSGEGRGKNNRKPDPEATGDHSVSNDRGSTTYEKNDRNPSGFQQVKRVDTKGASDKGVPTPHVHEGGTVRPATPNEIPKVDLSKNIPPPQSP